MSFSSSRFGSFIKLCSRFQLSRSSISSFVQRLHIVTCYFIFAMCYSLVATGCYLLLAIYTLLTCCFLLFICFLLLTICYFLLVTCYLILATCCLLIATCSTCCLLLAICSLMLVATSFLIHIKWYLLPGVCYLILIMENLIKSRLTEPKNKTCQLSRAWLGSALPQLVVDLVLSQIYCSGWVDQLELASIALT